MAIGKRSACCRKAYLFLVVGGAPAGGRPGFLLRVVGEGAYANLDDAVYGQAIFVMVVELVSCDFGV